MNLCMPALIPALPHVWIKQITLGSLSCDLQASADEGTRCLQICILSAAQLGHAQDIMTCHTELVSLSIVLTLLYMQFGWPVYTHICNAFWHKPVVLRCCALAMTHWP